MNRKKVVPIIKPEPDPDQDMAIRRMEFIAKSAKLRDGLRELQRDEFLLEMPVALEDVQRIESHLRDACRSIEVAATYAARK